MFRPSLFTMVYVVIGVVVAAVNDYFDSLSTVGRVVTAILAVILWPLVLIGFEIQVSR
jgi:hypothetical protein